MEWRYAEVDGKRRDVEQLKRGDRFRMREPDGSPVMDGDPILIADSDPEPCDPAGNFVLAVIAVH